MVEKWIKDANDKFRLCAETAYSDLIECADRLHIEKDYAVEVFRREFNRLSNINNE